MPAKAVNPDLSDIAALASILKTREARKAFQTVLRKGKSPTLSLTAAISASLVSAAAKEDEFDPLDGLAAVDDLSAFTELCLPGEAYAEAGHDHDALASGDGHDGHGGHASYLADPFASRFANIYARDHEEHEGHENHEAMAGGHGQHADAQSHGAGNPASHAAHANHQQGHESHHPHGADHQAAAAGDHAQGHHDQTGSEAHAAHEDHVTGHDMASHEAAGHGEAHTQHAPAAVETVHTDHASVHDDYSEPGDLEDDDIDLDQSIDALADNHHDVNEGVVTASNTTNDTPVEETPDEHHHHGVTLADMDTPPSDDLAATQPLPVI